MLTNVLEPILTFLNAGPEIADQIDKLIAFAEDLKGRFQPGQTQAMSADVIEELATAHPEVAALCDDIPGVLGGTRGGFRDLIGWVIKNPDQFIKWFNLIKDLFGLEKENTTQVE